MKLNNLKGIFLLLLSVAFVSCKKDWLAEKPSISVAVPATLKDCQALLDNLTVFGALGPGLGELASDGHYVLDATNSVFVAYNRNAYTWSHNEIFNGNITDWHGNYTAVFYCNLVLETLAKINPNADLKTWNDLKGQALFHRARCFYDLAQEFAPAYQETTANSDLGIPLRLVSDINKPSVRSSVKQTYEQIIKDLMEANDLLPITPVYKTRGSKSAVAGLLARAYLSMENYVAAGQYAAVCLGYYNTLMDYNQFTINPSSSANSFAPLNAEVIFHMSLVTHRGIFKPDIRIDPALYALYAEDDLRKTLFFYPNSAGGTGFKGTYTNSNGQFGGLATDEIYLIRAECYARAGKVTEAMKDLNDLIRKRWNKNKVYPEITASSPEDALVKVLTERRKELLLRGLRWSDLRRLNRDERFKLTLTRMFLGKTYTLQPNSYQYTFPIPDDVIAISNMPQNVGW
jgi:tetratricopeptide (TPR) repeat protein